MRTPTRVEVSSGQRGVPPPRPTRTHFEADDVGAALARLAETDVNARWQDAMAVYLDDRVADDGPALLPEVFRLD